MSKIEVELYDPFELGLAAEFLKFLTQYRRDLLAEEVKPLLAVEGTPSASPVGAATISNQDGTVLTGVTTDVVLMNDNKTAIPTQAQVMEAVRVANEKGVPLAHFASGLEIAGVKRVNELQPEQRQAFLNHLSAYSAPEKSA